MQSEEEKQKKAERNKKKRDRKKRAAQKSGDQLPVIQGKRATEEKVDMSFSRVKRQKEQELEEIKEAGDDEIEFEDQVEDEFIEEEVM